MKKSEDRIEHFLDAIEDTFADLDSRTQWPLNSGQMDAYFDVTESLDMYFRLNKLKNELSLEKIAQLMPPADVIRLFLLHNAIIGLKVADKLQIEKVSAEKRLEFANLLFDILEQKVQNDIFCRDGRNLMLDMSKLNNVLNKTNWNIPENDQEKRNLSFLNIDANNFCYTLYFDAYMSGGFYLHGPYDACEKFGQGAILLVREYHNLNPKELWPNLDFPYKKLQILAIYKDLDLKINFSSHPISSESVGDKLLAYKVFVDGKEILPTDIEKLAILFEQKALAQHAVVDSLTVLEQVRKGAEIAYYLFKDLRQYMGNDWRPSKYVDENIENFGDKFVKQFKYSENSQSIDHWRKLFDPRNDYY